MSVGAALTAISVWLNDMHGMFKKGEDLPHLATVVVVRGEMEKSSITRGFLVAKASYSFLKDNISASFCFPGWNKGRIICHRSQLKRLLSMSEPSADGLIKEELVTISDSAFPLPGKQIFTTNTENGELVHMNSNTGIRTIPELMTATI
eukprot:TRINITY_DN5894_c0_g3_i2.p1 TRINITY_DN5894_c0_g3~~TRINITY_DN5894_c0_g3_i2.p1  ORF type:complete len:149 (+),score=19.64 TRINITY_DN5894_c0_g3_i2:106-552(+)